MGLGFVAFRVLVLHLMALMSVCGAGTRKISKVEETNLLRLHGHDDQRKIERHGRMDHMDPSLLVFFTLKDLKLGSVMSTHFPKRVPSSSPKFLPKEKADSIPFSSKKLHFLLDYFSFSPDSPQATAMNDTLRHCESLPIKDEIKTCTTSLESLLDFTRSVFGSDAHIKVLTTKHLSKSNTLFQKWTITNEPKEIQTSKMVGCHSMPYPYAVFYCHTPDSETKVFEIPLRGENGDLVEAVGVCHMDTSNWSPDHVSFKVLGVQPGLAPVCHFFPADHLLWVASSPY